jgi:hypothetical protein
VFGGGYDAVQDNGRIRRTRPATRSSWSMPSAATYSVHAGPSTDAREPPARVDDPRDSCDVRAFDMTATASRTACMRRHGRPRVAFRHPQRPDGAQPRDGGVFASLGNAHAGTHPIETTRASTARRTCRFLARAAHVAEHRARFGLPRSSAQHPGPGPLLQPARSPAFARLTRRNTTRRRSDRGGYDAHRHHDTITPTIPPGAAGWRLDLQAPERL